MWNDPIEGYKNRRDYLIPCLETHRPIDLVILMLGTNDLKMRFSVSAFDIANSAGVLVDIIQKSVAGPDGAAPAVLLVAPPPVAKLSEFAEIFRRLAREVAQIRRALPPRSRRARLRFPRRRRGDSLSSDLDGIHFEPDEHRKLGEVMAQEVRRLLA